MNLPIVVLALAAAAAVVSGCSGDEQKATITLDGSSTVGPLMEQAAEVFTTENPEISIDVDVSRSGRGLDRFCAGEVDIANASRPIDEDEAAACAQAGVEYVQLQVASDALTIAIHRPILYDWVTCLTVAQLRKIWEPDSEVENWREVDPSFPDVPLKLFGADTDSGTFRYFTFVINGERGASRTDYDPAEDDNETVEGIAGAKGALGYFGFSYYQENRDRLTALAVDGGNGCVAPSAESVQSGTYVPLSRPLLIYVKQSSLARSPELRAFVRFVLENERDLAHDALFVPLTRKQVGEQLEKLDAATSAG